MAGHSSVLVFLVQNSMCLYCGYTNPVHLAILFTCKELKATVCQWLDDTIASTHRIRESLTGGVLHGPYNPIPFHSDKLWLIFRMHGVSALLQLINLKFKRRVWGLLFRLDNVMYCRLKATSSLVKRSISNYTIDSESGSDVRYPSSPVSPFTFSDLEDTPIPYPPHLSDAEMSPMPFRLLDDLDVIPAQPEPYFDSYSV